MPAENAGRAFALVLVDELVRREVRHAVIAPGSRSTPIALALLEHPDITVHVRIDERSAAYLALGIAKASNAIVPVLCTSGTAAAHFHGAVMEADLSRVPLLVLTADRPPELHGIGANQTVVQQGMYGEAVRWSPAVDVPEAKPDSVERWRALVAAAAAHAYGTRDRPPGPVHLNLPLRDPLIPVPDDAGFPYDLGLAADADGATVLDIEGLIGETPLELVGWLNGVTKGVVVAGGGAGVGVGLFAQRTGWPLVAEPHSGYRYGKNALRATDVLLRDPVFTAQHRPDLVVVFGRVGLSRVLLAWLATVPHVVVATDGGHWDVTRTAQAVIHVEGSVTAAAQAVTPADPAWLRSWRDASQQAAAAVDAVLDANVGLTEPSVAREVADRLADDATLVVASSMPIRDLDLVMRPREGLEVAANRGVSGIDGFVSTAMGFAIARAGRGPVVALCGDLSLLHDVNGLLPGTGERPDITFVVINNDGGGIFSLLPQGSAVDPAAFERLFGTPHGLSIEAIAAAYRVEYVRVTTPGELGAALAKHGGVRIVEVRTDRAQNARLHEELRALSVS
jgi:2-succinyl-5-enolpyruvyl-6-hydroxy-3-cyclohexene-1-carboxylate synthase